MINTKINIAVVGATGLVGENMIKLLEERNFPVENLYPLASVRSIGKNILFKGKSLPVEDVATFDFSKTQIALFSAGGSVSAQYVPKAAAAQCISIDNTSHFRYDADVPLMIPEVNPQVLTQYKQRYLIANPNCSTIQMLVALKPIYDAVGIARINVATYQAVSGAGKNAVIELKKQTAQLLADCPIESHVFPTQIAFNALPHIDTFQENGYTREEMKMRWETQKILEDDQIQVNPTAVRVPVFYGHSEAIHLETHEKITVNQVKTLLAEAPGVKVIDDDHLQRYPTAAVQASGCDEVYVGRIRADLSHPKGLNLWVVSDNVRKGGALNAIQIAEMLNKMDL